MSDSLPHFNLFRNFPPDLQFLLSPNVDFSKKSCTIPKLLDAMKRLGFSSEKVLGRNPRKAQVVAEFKKSIKPLIDDYIRHGGPNMSPNRSSSAAPSTSKCIASTSTTSTPYTPIASTSGEQDVEMLNSGIAESSRRTRQSCPSTSATSSSSTSKAIKLLKTVKDRVDLVNSMFKRSALIKLSKHLIRVRQNEKIVPIDESQFIAKPFIEPLGQMSTEDRDTCRKVLQAHHPHMFIPLAVASSKTLMLRLYNRFVLEENDNELCQGVHYDFFNPSELNFQGFISF